MTNSQNTYDNLTTYLKTKLTITS